MSKSAVIVAVGAISALSLGAGTFLAFRADQTPMSPVSVVQAPAAPSEAVAPAPSTEPSRATASSGDSAVVTRSTPLVRQPVQAPGTRETAVAAPAPRVAPSASGATESATPVPAGPPAIPPAIEPSPTAAASAATSSAMEPPAVQQPAKPRFEEVTVRQDSVVGIKIDQAVSSETAKVEDRVTAKVTRDVIVDGRTAIAAGAKLEGIVTLAERGGKFRERAKLGVRFTTLILADGMRVPLQTEAILREGDSPTGEAGSKIGASAVAGAILGGLIGGKRGAVIGSTAGAAGGTAVVASGGRNEAIIQGGAPLTVRLTAPVTLTIEREPEVR